MMNVFHQLTGGVMEKTLEKGDDKIQKICDSLRKETLEPAKEEAQKIVEEAKAHAASFLDEAREAADKLLASARESIEKERQVFHSSLEQAAKQSVEKLRQVIEHQLFHDELEAVLLEYTLDPQVIAKIIEAMIKAIDEEGISVEFSAVIPKTASPKDVNRLLGERIQNQLKEKSVSVGEFAGGAQIKLHDKKMTFDMTDRALIELLANYVRKDFRKFLFKS
ncbi:MAG: V-type ATP synthase subunit E [Waddliaceae bacterium]